MNPACKSYLSISYTYLMKGIGFGLHEELLTHLPTLWITDAPEDIPLLAKIQYFILECFRYYFI